MSVIQYPDAEAVSLAGAEAFITLAGEAVLAHGRFIVALSGGSTPKRMFQLLAEPERAAAVDWPRVHLFWGDERPVPPDQADSNYRMTNEALLSKLPAPGPTVSRIEAERADRAAAASEYEALIARTFGVPADKTPPSFDLIFLGMGPDGHTASLFPHTSALGEIKRWVVPNFVPKFNAERVTFTYPLINHAAEVIFLAAGADKAAVLAEVIDGPPEPQRLPSQAVRPTGRLRWFVDQAAATKLKPRP
jgi:6-phosphogluconolactonase